MQEQIPIETYNNFKSILSYHSTNTFYTNFYDVTVDSISKEYNKIQGVNKAIDDMYVIVVKKFLNNFLGEFKTVGVKTVDAIRINYNHYLHKKYNINEFIEIFYNYIYADPNKHTIEKKLFYVCKFIKFLYYNILNALISHKLSTITLDRNEETRKQLDNIISKNIIDQTKEKIKLSQTSIATTENEQLVIQLNESNKKYNELLEKYNRLIQGYNILKYELTKYQNDINLLKNANTNYRPQANDNFLSNLINSGANSRVSANADAGTNSIANVNLPNPTRRPNAQNFTYVDNAANYSANNAPRIVELTNTVQPNTAQSNTVQSNITHLNTIRPNEGNKLNNGIANINHNNTNNTNNIANGNVGGGNVVNNKIASKAESAIDEIDIDFSPSI